jgi:hypothetical protein
MMKREMLEVERSESYRRVDAAFQEFAKVLDREKFAFIFSAVEDYTPGGVRPVMVYTNTDSGEVIVWLTDVAKVVTGHG